MSDWNKNSNPIEDIKRFNKQVMSQAGKPRTNIYKRNLCFREFEDTDVLNWYCPECQEIWEGTYKMEKYKLAVAIEELKISLRKALKGSWLGKILLKLI